MADVPTAQPVVPSRRTVLSGTIWIGCGFGYTQVIRLAANVALAYLLFPEAFGLLALAHTVIVGLALFSDLGIRSSIIQNPRGDEPAFLNTAWTIQILRGFVLGVIACALAWPVAHFRAEPEPRLLWILPMLGLSAVIDGFVSTRLFTLQRHLAQRKAVLLEVVTQTLAIGTTVVWAALDGGVIALVMGPIVQTLIHTIASHVMLPGVRNRLAWDRSAARELFHFAKWVYLSTACFYLAGNVDKLVVGYQSLQLLGVYHMANQLALVSVLLLGSVAGQILFPLYSRWHQAGTDMANPVRRVHMVAGGAAALLIAGTIAAGPTLIRCLYDARYYDAAWILPLLALGAWFQVLDANAGQVLLAQGFPRYGAVGNGIKVVCLALFVPLFTYFDGLRGMIIGFIAGDLARYLFTAIILRRRGIQIFGCDTAWTLFVAIIGVGTNKLAELLLPLQDDRPKQWSVLMGRIAFEGGMVVIVWGCIVLWLRATMKRLSMKA